MCDIDYKTPNHTIVTPRSCTRISVVGGASCLSWTISLICADKGLFCGETGLFWKRIGLFFGFKGLCEKDTNTIVSARSWTGTSVVECELCLAYKPLLWRCKAVLWKIEGSFTFLWKIRGLFYKNSREKWRKCISVTGSLRGQAQVRPIDKLDEACTNADDRMMLVQHCSGDRVMR